MKHFSMFVAGVLLLSSTPMIALADSTMASINALPDFPASLRHKSPVTDLRDAAVYTINENWGAVDPELLQRKVGSDVLVRAWFKWNKAPLVSQRTQEPEFAHRLGEVFGGGITCSAVYDGENGLTQEQELDMVTRAPDGSLVDAWGQKGVRHGSLSSPAYCDYLFRWCKEQIDAGADYLFMDENTAALSNREGYDDHSLADFRQYLIHDCTDTRGWKLNDSRWKTRLGINLADSAICPSGSMDRFDYRAYMRENGIFDRPDATTNKLFPLWQRFRSVRDDRVWHALTDRIRAYGRSLHRTIFISGNGMVKYVDLQITGYPYALIKDGHIDLMPNQVELFRGLVQSGQHAAGRPVPFVLFQDWGFTDPPYPWEAIPPSERIIWMRTRAAELYAAGGFFAFPVRDAGKDGTLATMAHLTEFYQRQRNIYLRSQWLGADAITSGGDPLLSLSTSWIPASRTVAVHVINRELRDGALRPRGPIEISLKLGQAPANVTAISPDFDGARPVAFHEANGVLRLTLPAIDAYTVVLLHYERTPDLSTLRDTAKIHTVYNWGRPDASQFPIRSDGSIRDDLDVVAYLQGMLHTEMRNPPTFLVNAGNRASVNIHVRAVASLGARIQISIDGKPVRTLNLPDLDGKNDGAAAEYDKTYSCPIPPGRHRVLIDNIGGDWATIDWYTFAGMAGNG
ncbi:MAG: hypothetical protein P4L33_03895 [Capsulimonadaceae bacterium]|nr:hypothetical protein [Capsulimonadaceae bacterium]